MAALPRLARRLSDVLGESLARLHRLDPTPVRARLVDADVGGLGVAALLSGFTGGAIGLIWWRLPAGSRSTRPLHHPR